MSQEQEADTNSGKPNVEGTIPKREKNWELKVLKKGPLQPHARANIATLTLYDLRDIRENGNGECTEEWVSRCYVVSLGHVHAKTDLTTTCAVVMRITCEDFQYDETNTTEDVPGWNPSALGMIVNGFEQHLRMGLKPSWYVLRQTKSYTGTVEFLMNEQEREFNDRVLLRWFEDQDAAIQKPAEFVSELRGLIQRIMGTSASHNIMVRALV